MKHTIFFQNKIKKEEAFTRLNIAKINENWHQILRKIKVQAQKTEIADLRLWITKVIEIKNNIISKLMKEIEDSEEQYLHNMRSHTCHINSFLGNIIIFILYFYNLNAEINFYQS